MISRVLHKLKVVYNVFKMGSFRDIQSRVRDKEKWGRGEGMGATSPHFHNTRSGPGFISQIIFQ